jgi:hypothetical protein
MQHWLAHSRGERKRTQDAAGEFPTATKDTHRPGLAPALGLRAGNDGVFILLQINLVKEIGTMSLSSWLSEHLGLSGRPASRRKTFARRPRFRPMLEGLEQRWVPSTLTVTNALDSGPGSLRAAISAAPNGATIDFASSLNGQTITLGGELLIKKGLTISGPGASQLAISGQNASRLFDVTSSTTKQVTLSGLTLEDGTAPAGPAGGGAILNLGTLAISNCVITSNSASQGGAIDNQTGSKLTVTKCTVSNNTAGTGGGISNYGTLTVTGSTFSGNTATSAGGIYNRFGCSMTVTGSTFSNNHASAGGGIYNSGTATISTSTLSGNTAGTGGGIRNDSGSLTLSGSTLTGNTATAIGDGIDIVGGTVTIKNSTTITGNTTPTGSGVDVYNRGGVLYVDASSIIGILDGNPAVPI